MEVLYMNYDIVNQNSSPVTPKELSRHSTEFKQEILNVTEDVYVAIGYGLANSILLEGRDGVIIVDTLESVEAAVPVKQAFDKITSKPVKAIIYTHYHSDHIGGAGVFAGNNKVDVYTQEETVEELNRVAMVSRAIYKRSMAMFGTFLKTPPFINDGIGPFLYLNNDTQVAYIPPNKTFSKEIYRVTIAGLNIELIPTPGETNGEIAVWLPDKGVLIGADTYYKSFPNLYSIRGTKFRNPDNWASSVELLRRLQSQYLIPCHTRPIVGQKKINRVLSDYRDAIQYVHDQTLRGINKGLTPDELVKTVSLPSRLADKPYLREFYGNIEWCIKNIFYGYLGWFNGNATYLFPLSLMERANRFARLSGGETALFMKTQEAFLQRDYQWVLELTDQLLLLPNYRKEAIHMKSKALWNLGLIQGNAPARNYYLTQALEVAGKLTMPPLKTDESIFLNLEIMTILKLMAINLNPKKSLNVYMAAKFDFTDLKQIYTVNVRSGVAIVEPYILDKLNFTVICSSIVWKSIIGDIIKPSRALLKGDLKIDGSIVEFYKFLSLFNDRLVDDSPF
jgi:alkyl sulfatase BDS1-like metallo-beta-lactamase superfamily hydrolase